MTEAQQPLPGIPWLNIPDPNSPALDEVAKRFHLHELQIEDCRHRPQRVKTDEYGKYVFSILKHVQQTGNELDFDDLDIFLGKDFLITVHRRDCAAIRNLQQVAQRNQITRLDQLFYRLVDAAVDDYGSVLDNIGEEVTNVESEMLKHPDPPMLRNIFQARFHIKRRLIEFNHIAADMRAVVNSLIRREDRLWGDDLDPYFRDVYDHLLRIVDRIESYRDLLAGLLDIYLSAEAYRTNEVMKILTIWGTVALPLVIITGFFGMNLPLPWANRPQGTLFAVGLMLVSTTLVLLYLKRKHWF
jgi:magnesium transporter